MPKIVCVVPTCRPQQMESFKKAWRPLFEKHQVTQITVWDGDEPSKVHLEIKKIGETITVDYAFLSELTVKMIGYGLLCSRTDACRNLGLAYSAFLNADLVFTADDDVVPLRFDTSPVEWRASYPDPIQSHIDALSRRVPISWINTAHDTDLYLRGVPYGVRNEAPVMLSHGVWVGTPDFDGETQLNLEQGYEGESQLGHEVKPRGVPYSLPYFVGPIPKGTLFPLCGMNVMIRREALPYFYFAPMGPDSGVPNLNRFADIWMGIFLKRQFDILGWACVTGYSTVLHTRASDAKKNFEQEKLGRQWNELLWRHSSMWDERGELLGLAPGDPMIEYLMTYVSKRERYATLIKQVMGEVK